MRFTNFDRMAKAAMAGSLAAEDATVDKRDGVLFPKQALSRDQAWTCGSVATL